MNIESNAAVFANAAAVNVSVLIFNGLNQLLLIKRYSVSMVAALVRIRRFSNSYITILVSSNGSNGVGIILLNKIAQLLAINAKLICMIAVCTFIFNRQDIGINSYCSNGVGVSNIFQLISYPAAGCYIFYNRLNVIACRIINPYRQLAIFIQVSFHASVSCVGILRCRCILNKSPQSILVDAD